ncbi:MAG: hypothetical protein MI866_06340 [Bacteroidales bacterium]|nr:hypothetical protein [Bacteroidales bacterium]
MAKSKSRKKQCKPTRYNKYEVIKPFIKRLRELCELYKCDAMQYITSKHEFMKLARLRVQIGTVISVDNEFKHINPPKVYYNKLIKEMLKKPSVYIKELDTMVSFTDYTNLKALHMYLEDDELNNKEISDKCLKQLQVYIEDNNAIDEAIIDTLLPIAMAENLPDEPQLSLGYAANGLTHSDRLYGFIISFQLYIVRPGSQTIFINGQKRIVYPVKIHTLRKKTHHAFIKANDLGQLYKGKNEHLCLYIQPHAIKRFKERLAPIHEIAIKMSFNLCMLKNIKPICHNDSLLIPYKLDYTKLGYFVAVVADDMIVIKTFILISHASAPEGWKFQKLTGFGKQDMSYWDITKLDTFIYNDMKPDNPMYNYFEESGLLPLFDLNASDLRGTDPKNIGANWQQVYKCINKMQNYKDLSQEDFDKNDLTKMMKQ